MASCRVPVHSPFVGPLTFRDVTERQRQAPWRRVATRWFWRSATTASGSTPLPASGHLGLRSMQERAIGVGGSVKVVSAYGDGSRVVVRVPLARQISIR